MPIIEINRLHVVEENAAAFETAFAKASVLLLQVAGCRSARLLRCIEASHVYEVVVEWDRLEDHQVHYPKTSQAIKIRALLMPLIAQADPKHFRQLA